MLILMHDETGALVGAGFSGSQLAKSLANYKPGGPLQAHRKPKPLIVRKSPPAAAPVLFRKSIQAHAIHPNDATSRFNERLAYNLWLISLEEAKEKVVGHGRR
jgi:hypothetical protein